MVAGGFLLFDFQFSGLTTLQKDMMLGVGVLWFPVIVVVMHLTLPARFALWLSLAYNFIAIIMSATTFLNTRLSDIGINALLQFHAANLVLTAFIAVFGRMRQHYHSVKEQANTDVLTGLQNRRFMQQLLEQTHSNTSVYAILLLDVDNFKQLNDTHGHAFGDIVLRELGFILESHLRRGDAVARWGGEEFLLLLPETALQEAHKFAERLRKIVIDARLAGTRITVSIGLSVRQPEESIEDVLARADDALYRAKNNGRDQVRSTLVI